MVDSHRQSPSQATAKHQARLANKIPGNAPGVAPGISEAGAWWRQARAAMPRWLLVAAALVALGLLLFWYAHA